MPLASLISGSREIWKCFSELLVTRITGSVLSSALSQPEGLKKKKWKEAGKKSAIQSRMKVGVCLSELCLSLKIKPWFYLMRNKWG